MKCSGVFVGILAAVLYCSPLSAQSFSSGSTGADGALSVANGNALALQLPESGIFNFTTVTIGSNAELYFLPNSRNTAVVILAQYGVQIDGAIEVSAPTFYSSAGAPNYERIAGPGGFSGGFWQNNGFGAGGGVVSNNSSTDRGRWVGPLTLVPIVGGSGGAGYYYNGGGERAVGAGGGGAIVIASSLSITVAGSGRIRANGATAGASWGQGSGGAIRLVANSMSISGSLQALAGDGSAYGSGVIRVEAPPESRFVTGSSTPAAVLSTINPSIVPTTSPTLTITSIAGFPVPIGAGQRPDTVGLLLPTQLTDPISVVVNATDIPVGSQVAVSINGSPGATATQGTLAGTDQASTATLSISGLDRTKVIFLFVSVTFDVLNLAQAGNPAGPDQIAMLKVEAEPGKSSRVAFLRQDGTEVARNLVPPNIRQLFGQ